MIGSGFRFAANNNSSLKTKRWIAKHLPLWQFRFGEAQIVVASRSHDRRVFRIERLHQNSSASFPSTRSARHLRDQRERSLGRSKIRQVQSRVGVDDSHQRHVWKVQALGDHLSPQQDFGITLAKTGQRLFMTAGTLHRVGIHPHDWHAMKQRSDLHLQPLSPKARKLDRGIPAVGATFGGWNLMITIVAGRFVPVLVMR